MAESNSTPPLPTAMLIIVCCHSVFHGPDLHDEKYWSLAPFQRASGNKPSENITFLAHIKEALKVFLQADCSSPASTGIRPLVVFSGGYTNAQYPDNSEAAGYMRAAKHLIEHDTIGEFSSLRMKSTESWTALEERATDLYQNVIFSILRYKEVCGSYPHQIVVVTHAFKAERVRMHAEAISWNREFDVRGIDPPFDDQERAQVVELERKNARDLFSLDPYGARSPLRDKRLARRWTDEVVAQLATGHPESVDKLLQWTGGENGNELFMGELPWSTFIEK